MNKTITSSHTQSTNGALKTINSSRLTVDPEGNLFFSNVTRWSPWCNNLENKQTCIGVVLVMRDLSWNLFKGWTLLKTFCTPAPQVPSSETNTNLEIASSYRCWTISKSLKPERKGLKLLTRLSGYPIGVKRGAAEQTPAREAICDEEELHRIQGEESQGDYF